MNAVDVHVHVAVPEILRDAAPNETWRPLIETGADGRPVVTLGDTRIRSMVGPFTELDAVLADRAALGIDGILLCPWVALLYPQAAPLQALERCRLQNTGLARMRAQAPDRVSVLAAIPMQDPELAAAELAALMAGGEFAGVEVTASVDGISIGDPRFEPVWSAAAEHDALVFVHPATRGFRDPAFSEHYLWNLVGNPMETTLAAAHLVLGGTMTRHPRLRMLLAHGGGAILALSGRLRHGQAAVSTAGPPAAEPAGAADAVVRNRFLFDTVTHDPSLLAGLVAAVGANRVLLGSDHPFDMADPDPVATVRAARLGAEGEHAILGGNAARELRTASPKGEPNGRRPR